MTNVEAFQTALLLLKNAKTPERYEKALDLCHETWSNLTAWEIDQIQAMVERCAGVNREH